MKITKQRLKEIIKEELNEVSNPPEWESADKILRALVYLAQDLEDSSDADPAGLASAIVGKLREAVDAMERRLNEKFTPEDPEDEDPDVEPLVLPKVTPDSLKRMRQGIHRVKTTGRWDKK